MRVSFVLRAALLALLVAGVLGHRLARPVVRTENRGTRLVLRVGGVDDSPTPEPSSTSDAPTEEGETPAPGHTHEHPSIIFAIVNELEEIREIDAEELRDDLDDVIQKAANHAELIQSNTEAIETSHTTLSSLLVTSESSLTAQVNSVRSSLTSQVQQITSTATATSASLSRQISSAASAATATVAAEATRASGVETALQSQITAAAAASNAADSTIRLSLTAVTNTVASEISTARAREAGLSGQIISALSTINAATCIELLGKVRVGSNCLDIGTSSSAPARSCRQLQFLGKPTGTYWVRHTNGGAATIQTACDMDQRGGGWELLMNIDGAGTQFAFDNPVWTSTNTIGGINKNWGVNYKGHGFNYGSFGEVEAWWRDPYDGQKWVWQSPRDFEAVRRPLSYFQQGRDLDTNLYGPHIPDWNGHFSYQDGARAYSVATCKGGNYCQRWGFSWNNEGSFGSNDAQGGIGLRTHRNNARSAGDWYGCCGYGGRNRDFDVQIWGRADK